MDKERLLLKTLSEILKVTPIINKNSHWDWQTNRLSLIDSTFQNGLLTKAAEFLNWDYPRAYMKVLPYTAYLPGKYNCLFLYDDFYKFTTYRLKTLELYSEEIPLNFDKEHYKYLCHSHFVIADSYQKNSKKKDFNFYGGKAASRAMLDVFLDIKPIHNGLNPTFRLNYFDIFEADSKDVDKNIKALTDRFFE